jgi:hypothetical protein
LEAHKTEPLELLIKDTLEVTAQLIVLEQKAVAEAVALEVSEQMQQEHRAAMVAQV